MQLFLSPLCIIGMENAKTPLVHLNASATMDIPSKRNWKTAVQMTMNVNSTCTIVIHELNVKTPMDPTYVLAMKDSAVMVLIVK